MKKALFGEDTQEQRDLKIKHLDEQIKITEIELKQINEEYKYVLLYMRQIVRIGIYGVSDQV